MATNKYRFGDSQKLCLVRILRSAVMVRVGGGWVALDEFLVKNDPCRASQWKSLGDFNEDLHSSSDCVIAPINQGITMFRRKSSSTHRQQPSSQCSTTSGSSYISLPTSNHDLNAIKNNDKSDNTVTDYNNNNKHRRDRQTVTRARNSVTQSPKSHKNSVHGEIIHEKI
uniref:SJCHGC07857 protein n=1 Tax=Schistosoma japonicum TaxID=6182 RepID=Q5DHA8_SCHJA|nr:SJCHGC07857 protein [Schistosoma japonicum]